MELENTNTTNNNPVSGEKTFTQDDVNRIVSARLAQEKSKADTALAEREQQLSKREMLFNAKEKITAMGLPAELLDALDASSPEALEKAMHTVKSIFDKVKSEARPYTISGTVPAESGAKMPSTKGNSDLRKAMGLL